MPTRHSLLPLFCLISLATAQGTDPLRQNIILAADGTFLGTCDGPLAPLSLTNWNGPYGSTTTPKSMFNPYGPYGSTTTRNSPQNPRGEAAYLFKGTPELLALVTAPTYRPTAKTLAQMKAARARRVSVSPTFIGAITPQTLKQRCQAF